MNSITVFGKRRVRAKWKEASRLADRILILLRESSAALEVYFLSSREITAINSRFFRRKRRVSGEKVDVLAFPHPHGFPNPSHTKGKTLGEIYINQDCVRRKKETLARLLIHGILHLLGHDHQGHKDALNMEALEEEVFKKAFP